MLSFLGQSLVYQYSNFLSLRFFTLFLLVSPCGYAELPPIVDIYQTPDSPSEIQGLRNEIETLKKSLAQAHETIKSQTALFESQEKKKAPRKPLLQRLHITQAKPSEKPAQPEAPNARAEKAWEAACQLSKSQQYTEAIQAFQKFIKQYPKHKYQAHAYYTLAQLELVTGNPKQSLRYAKLLLKKYPDDVRAPDAQFCMGLAYYAQHNNTMAYKTFTQLVEHHPEEPIAQKAREHLKQMNLKKSL